MDRNKAQQEATDAKYTFGELKTLIETARTRGGMSCVNTQFTIAQTCEIFADGIKDRPDNERPNGFNREAFLVINILRDCA